MNGIDGIAGLRIAFFVQFVVSEPEIAFSVLYSTASILKLLIYLRIAISMM